MLTSTFVLPPHVPYANGGKSNNVLQKYENLDNEKYPVGHRCNSVMLRKYIALRIYSLFP